MTSSPMSFVCAAAGVVASLSMGPGCITALNPVVYERALGAPQVPARPDGCAVIILDENEHADRPTKTLGRITLEWSANQMKDQGQEKALETLKAAACENGAHYVLDMRALPRGYQQGMVFEGDLAVLVDEKGEPMQGHTTGTASSTAEVTGSEVPPPTAGADGAGGAGGADGADDSEAATTTTP